MKWKVESNIDIEKMHYLKINVIVCLSSVYTMSIVFRTGKKNKSIYNKKTIKLKFIHLMSKERGQIN